MPVGKGREGNGTGAPRGRPSFPGVLKAGHSGEVLRENQQTVHQLYADVPKGGEMVLVSLS